MFLIGLAALSGVNVSSSLAVSLLQDDMKISLRTFLLVFLALSLQAQTKLQKYVAVMRRILERVSSVPEVFTLRRRRAARSPGAGQSMTHSN